MACFVAVSHFSATDAGHQVLAAFAKSPGEFPGFIVQH
jgi:hypothetical protein